MQLAPSRGIVLPIRNGKVHTTVMGLMNTLSPGQPAPAPAPATAALAVRLSSIDAYRGFVMFLMMAEVLNLARVASAHPDTGFWRFLAHHQSHVDWIGCSLHDLI